MPDMNVTTKLVDLKVLFNDVKEIYYKSTPILTTDLGDDALDMDIELPVLEDGVSFDTGEADVTEIKLTTGAIWVAKADKGDSDISLQVASVAGEVNDLLLEKKAEVGSVTGIIDGSTYKGAAYSLAPKKLTGSLLLKSEDRQTIVILPNVEMYSNLVVSDGDNPAYFNVSVTPLENDEGADIIILYKDTED